MSNTPDETRDDDAVEAQSTHDRRSDSPRRRDSTGRAGADPGPPRFGAPLRPLVDAVARVPASLHAKLLVGFLMVSVLLLAMGALCLIVIARMSHQVDDISELHAKDVLAFQLEHTITLQSHLRAMAILTRSESYNDEIEAAKQRFTQDLAALEQLSSPAQAELLQQVRRADERYAAAGERVLAVYRSGDMDGAMGLHLSQEHPISHELESAMQRLEVEADGEMDHARDQITADHDLLRGMVGSFSAVSLLLAALLGYVLFWAFIFPVRRVDTALAGMAAGDFTQRVEVPNRDELGTLSQNLNVTSDHLDRLYRELNSLNAHLTARVEELTRDQVKQAVARFELERAWEIQRQLLPTTLPTWPGRLELAVRFRPARETSGDFYDVVTLAPSEPTDNSGGQRDAARAPLQIAVGDVAGKGIAAALVMALARATLGAIAETVAETSPPVPAPHDASGARPVPSAQPNGWFASSPASTMQRASGRLHRDIGARDFVACALAVVEPPSGGGSGPSMRLANATQAPPLLCRDGGAVELVPPGERLPLGILPHPEYHDLAVELRPGDVIVFASDGLPEAPARAGALAAVNGAAAGGVRGAALPGAAGPGELFGFERLATSAAYWAQEGRDADTIAAGIWADVNAWSGEGSDHDDMTLLVLRVPPGEESDVNGP
jgi:serine phosphatase RsbU (regulator of sigma subunit)/CHASE3 domain sensor protein